MTAPSPKEALEAAMRAFKACRPIERVACQDFGMQQDDILEQQLEAALSAALATLQPSGDRRDAIARRLKSRIGSGRTVTVGPGLYEDISEAADAILASGLVQDEAGIRADEPTPDAPDDPREAFAYFVSKCAEGLGKELMESGQTETQARNQIIHHLLDFAAGEACRVAREEHRSPDREKWTEAVDGAFARAFKRTAAIRSARNGGDET